MKLLLIPASYPHAAAQWAGVMNERSALALRRIVQDLEVLTPAPYAPGFLAFNNRLRGYSLAPRADIRNGITVHRPFYPVLPKVVQGFWPSAASYLFCRGLARRRHRSIGFDAILSFDLALTGGLAWRLGRDLGIAACGWATGSDMRWNRQSSMGRSVRASLERLDLIFYQSHELQALGADFLETDRTALSEDRHVVQARGVGDPEAFSPKRNRGAVRSRLQLSDDKVVILYLGRIVRAKGVFDLVQEFVRMRTRPNIVLVLVGSRPGYDETFELQKIVDKLTDVNRRVQILPGCPPSEVGDYFAAADIFAFPSFREGMPNSLLEAMLAGLPAVAFAIPAVREISRFGTGLIEVPPFHFSSFGDSLSRLAADKSLRHEIGDRGRTIVRQHFSVERSMQNVAKHIQRMMLGRASLSGDRPER